MKENHRDTIECLIPAAGLSSRMNDWKLMLPYKNKYILDVSIENALSFCTKVILIVGYRHEELIARYKTDKRIKIVINQDYKNGMFSSIQAGVQHVTGTHFFIAHGDMPCIQPQTYQTLWQQRNSGTTFPGTSNKTGHPVLINSSLISPIISSPHTSSMKVILKQHEINYLALADKGIYLDVDTPEAYQALLKECS